MGKTDFLSGQFWNPAAAEQLQQGCAHLQVEQLTTINGQVTGIDIPQSVELKQDQPISGLNCALKKEGDDRCIFDNASNGCPFNSGLGRATA